MAEWIDTLKKLAEEGESAVLVTVGRIRGSAPRETGARMVVTRRHAIGSIGGGQLEYTCTELACKLLTNERAVVLSRTFPLGPDLGQCCGGVVDIVFERLPASRAEWLETAARCHEARIPAVVMTSAGADSGSNVVTAEEGRSSLPADTLAVVDEVLAGRAAATVGDAVLVPLTAGTIDVAIFGAGHVGAAIVDLLAKLDSRIRWIDSRRQMFPSSLPANVTAIESADPAHEVASVPPGAYCLVMTHSHPVDLEICERLLMRDDLAFRGLIGSRSKQRRFNKRLASMGLTKRQLERLVCPIGIDGVNGKKPAEIAVGVAAQLLKMRDAQQSVASPARSLKVLG